MGFFEGLLELAGGTDVRATRSASDLWNGDAQSRCSRCAGTRRAGLTLEVRRPGSVIIAPADR